jgi:Abortive infection alpha
VSEENKPVSVNVNTDVGKETDKTVGDILRALLLKPATELGTLIGDGIGILGDKVRALRLKNIELGMQETRKQLEARSLDLKDITPPDEIEFHGVLEGMSTSTDENIRRLWAGLLAISLDPNRSETIERSITTVIDALNAQDARVISFLVFAELQQKILQERATEFYPRIIEKARLMSHDPEAKESHKSLRGELTELQTFFSQRIVRLATKYDILFTRGDQAGKRDWFLNLDRLGLIELSGSSISSKVSRIRMHASDVSTARSLETMAEAIQELAKHSVSDSGDVYLIEDGRWHVSLGVMLTPFGRKFAATCGLFDQPLAYWLPEESTD